MTECPAAIGMPSPTAASNAISARESASCTKASAGCASCGRVPVTEIVLTTYGRSSGFCLDPIEKKPLNHFLPGTAVLSFGTAGCNLTCKFCQNWDISKARDLDRLQQQASPQAIAQAACATGARSVAFTYNDPVIFLEYAVDVAAACREVGLQTVAVTAGYIGKVARPEFFAAMDAANIDLKAFTESFYKQLCTGSLDAVLDTLVYVKHETEDLARDHHLAYSRQERSRPMRWVHFANGWRRGLGPTCHCISRPSIPIGRCWMFRRLRLPLSNVPARSR